MITNVLLAVLCGTIVLSLIVFIHEGGHYLTARAFGVRVTEFMLGLPGPNIGFQKGETKFGLTCVPLGGYARVCGMSDRKPTEHTVTLGKYIYEKGTASEKELMEKFDLTEKQVDKAVQVLYDWGTITFKGRNVKTQKYLTPAYSPTRKQVKQAKSAGQQVPQALAAGTPREIEDFEKFLDEERKYQYSNLPFWKRSVILLAGVTINLLFAIVALIVIYSILGYTAVWSDGTTEAIRLTPLQSIQVGVDYIGAVVSAVIGLFNPQTAGDTISNSTSVIGIAALSVEYFTSGVQDALLFMAMISVSLGIMNLLPIPPLDGGRFLVELIQKISRRTVPERLVNYVSVAATAVFALLFVVMANQDIQRFVFGNW